MEKFNMDSANDGEQRAEMQRLRNMTLGIYQDNLIEHLLSTEVIGYEDIQNLYPEPDEDNQDPEPNEIYHWISASISEWDIKALNKAQIPYIDHELGQWVGRTDTGSAEDLYFLPSYLNALYGND